MTHTTSPKLTIPENALAAEICEEFRRQFPYLRLVLKEKGRPLASTRRLIYTHPVAENPDGLIEIRSSTAVSELVDLFEKYFQVSLTLLRRSGTTWLETVRTSTWSLGEQNAEGEYLSNRRG